MVFDQDNNTVKLCAAGMLLEGEEAKKQLQFLTRLGQMRVPTLKDLPQPIM